MRDAVLTRAGEQPTETTESPTPAPMPSRPPRWRAALLPLASAPFLLFLLLPLVALVLRVPPAELLSHVMDPAAAQALQLSLSTTLMTVLITVVAGTPVAYLLARRRFRGRTLLDTLIDLPMVLPPAVAGVALLVAFGRHGAVGHLLAGLDVTLPFTPAAVVLAQTFVASPFYIKAAEAAFAGVDSELEQAAALDGASPLAAFRYVTLPLTAHALFGGAVLTWARALGEFGATIIFAGNFPGRTQTMPLAIYIGFELDFAVALTLSVILLALSFAVLLVVRYVLRERIAAFT